MPTVAIEVVNERLAEHMRRGYPLPVRIGRGAGCDIQLDPENRAISRLHVELVEENGRIVLYNRASNQSATLHRGRGLQPGERVELDVGDVFRIFDFEVKIIQPPRLGILFAARKDLRVRAEYPLVPGGALLATAAGGRLDVARVDDVAKVDPSTLKDKLAALFYYDGEEPTFAVLSNPEQLQVLLDRGFVQQDALYIQPLDTIEIGEHRFEVHSVGSPAIVCENVKCQVLNAYDRGDNCRLCGTRLFGETRLVRGQL